ncbi:MAG: dephospho-CoA kinase [Deltaproteobacteria bacterium]|nr:dephospho-CoA kinase [Deltaproteobacteria bacterium]
MGTRVIGLTGGIASGKSTVAHMLAELGAAVIDADQVARDIVRPGQPALAAIVAAFGAEVLTTSGEVDRKRLAERVFADPAARRQLERITHPRILEETARRVAELGTRGVAVVVYEASLLVESGGHRGLAGLIVVAASAEVQLRRLQERDGLAADEAARRLAAQAPLRDKVAVADYVIDGSAALETTRAQVAAAWSDILAGGPRRRV